MSDVPNRVRFEPPLDLPDAPGEGVEVDIAEEGDVEIVSDDVSDALDASEDASEDASGPSAFEDDADDVRAQLEEARARAAEAERARQQQVGQNVAVVSAAIANEEERIRLARGAAQRELREAIERGDIDAQVSGQEKLVDIRASELRLNDIKAEFEQRKNAQVQVSASQAQRPQAHPKTQAWVQSRPWWSDPKHIDARNFALATEASLAAAGLRPDQDAYWAEMDRRIHRVFPELATRRREPRRGVAPVSREGSGGGVAKGQRVRLTARQVQFAKDAGIPLDKMAEEVRRQQSEAG